MIAKEVRNLTNMCSSPYDLLTMLELGGQPTSNAMVALNQLTTGVSGVHQGGAATVKRRKKSTAAPNPKKMFEEVSTTSYFVCILPKLNNIVCLPKLPQAQMVRRVKAYLAKMKVITDEEKLHELSTSCEGSSTGGSIMGSGPIRKRHPSPTLSTASSASSASEGLKNTGPKFGNYNIIITRKRTCRSNSCDCECVFEQNILGSASPQAVRKLLSLSEPSKTRLHQPRYHMAPSPGPPTRRNVHQPPSVPATSHERSHSDTTPLNPPPPLLLSSVDLNAESSSVTSLSNLSLRKTVTSSKW